MNRFQRKLLASAALALAATCLAGCLPPGATSVDAGSEAVLKRLSATLAGAESFSYSGKRQIDHRLNPQGNLKEQAAISGTVQRPASYAGTATGSGSVRSVTTDGKTLTVFDSNGKVYAAIAGKPSLDATLDSLAKDWGIKPPMAPFMRSDFYRAVTSVGGSWESLGTAQAGGVTCDRLLLTIPDGTAELLVARSDGLPRAFTITYTSLEGDPQIRVTDLRWKLNVKTTPGQFQAKLPAGAREVQMVPLSR